MEKIQSLIKAILQQILSPFLYTAHARGQLSGHRVHSLIPTENRGLNSCLVPRLFREHSGRTNDMDTKEYATFRYDTVEVENGLNGNFPPRFLVGQWISSS